MIGALARGLDWLGGQGTRAVAVSLLLGMALPPLAAFFRPVLPVAIFLLLVLALVRIDFVALADRVRQWRMLAWALLWVMVVMPLAIALTLRLSGFADAYPGWALGIFITTAAPPVMSVAALAALMRLDYALSVAMLVLSALVTPLVAPLVGVLALPAALPLEASALAMRLGLLMAGALAVALVIRAFVGLPAIERARSRIDGTNVVILFVFAVAAMDGVARAFLETPGLAFGILGAVFAIAFLQIGLSMLALWRAERVQALTIALGSGIRNMGVFIAVLGPAVPETTWLFFGIAQFPIYMLPLILKVAGDRFAAVR